MILTKGQEEGLKIALDRYKTKEPYTVIAGYAGVGKSFLVSIIISALNIPQEEVAYIAYTGKAALVLSNKGCPNATTAHKLLYKSILLPDGKYMHVPLEQLEKYYKVIVVDEVSMLPQDMWQLLLSHKIHVIALGDPGQLDPISGTNDILSHPHIFLTEIMRQSLDNEIINLSMQIREGKPLENFKGKDIQILPKSSLNQGMLLWADQILVATNNKRQQINRAVKECLGKNPDMPEDGDKIICTRNCWDIIGSEGNPLVNGSIGTISNGYKDYFIPPKYIYDQHIDIFSCIFKAETGDTYNNINCDYYLLQKGKTRMTDRIKYSLLKNKRTKFMLPQEFEYGYAITVNKSQGSEWDKILILEEDRFPFSKQERIKWLYTAATRAAKKLVIIKKED